MARASVRFQDRRSTEHDTMCAIILDLAPTISDEAVKPYTSLDKNKTYALEIIDREISRSVIEARMGGGFADVLITGVDTYLIHQTSFPRETVNDRLIGKRVTGKFSVIVEAKSRDEKFSAGDVIRQLKVYRDSLNANRLGNNISRAADGWVLDQLACMLVTVDEVGEASKILLDNESMLYRTLKDLGAE